MDMDRNMRRGKFVVFEGLDGAGCSTQAKLLYDYLQRHGHPAVLTGEPYERGEAARKIKEILWGQRKVTPKYLQQLFVQNRKEHLKQEVEPALWQQMTVICDRYFYSGIAFGSIDLDPEWLMQANAQFPQPDATFLIAVSPEKCMERINASGKAKEIFEKVGKLRKAWKTYQILPERFPRVYIINGEGTIAETHKHILAVAQGKVL